MKTASLPAHQQRTAQLQPVMDGEQGSRSMSPPPFQLKAAPIQRVINDSDPIEFDTLKKAIKKAGLGPVTSWNEVEIAFDKEQAKKRKMTIPGFIRYLKSQCFIDKDGDDNDNDPHEEETKGKKIRRTGATDFIFNMVYKPNSSNPFYINTQIINGKSYHAYTCFANCGSDVLVNSTTMKEKGVRHGKNRTKKRPPVCHSGKYPASHTMNSLEDNYKYLSGNNDPTSFNPLISKFVQRSLWDFKQHRLTTGHTSCNSSHKDSPWSRLPKKRKLEYTDKTMEYVQEISKKRKLNPKDVMEGH